MHMFMEYLVPLLGVFIGNLLFNGFIMWLVITKIVGSSEDAGFVRCVVCYVLISIVMLICILPFVGFIFIFPFILLLWPLLAIGYLWMAYKGCSSVIETVFELPDGLGRGIFILFVLVNFGVGWTVNHALAGAQKGITYAQQGYMSKNDFLVEFHDRLSTQLKDRYYTGDSEDPEDSDGPDEMYAEEYSIFPEMRILSMDGVVYLEFNALDFYEEKIQVGDAVTRVELLMDTLTGTKPSTVVMELSPDAPRPPQPPAEITAPLPPSGEDEVVPEAPRPPQLAATSESASTVPQVNKILPVPSGLIGRPIMVADENEEYLGLIKRLFQIEGDIPLMGIPYIVRRNEL